MEKKTVKKTLKISGIVLLLLSAVLCLHIYDVTHRKPDGTQRVMARINLQQDINEQDAAVITTWLYGCKGVDHVLCNAASDIAVFTFSPDQNSADNIINSFIAESGYKAVRYMPAKKDLMSGCPVAAVAAKGSLNTLYKQHTFFN